MKGRCSLALPQCRRRRRVLPADGPQPTRQGQWSAGQTQPRAGRVPRPRALGFSPGIPLGHQPRGPASLGTSLPRDAFLPAHSALPLVSVCAQLMLSLQKPNFHVPPAPPALLWRQRRGRLRPPWCLEFPGGLGGPLSNAAALTSPQPGAAPATAPEPGPCGSTPCHSDSRLPGPFLLKSRFWGAPARSGWSRSPAQGSRGPSWGPSSVQPPSPTLTRARPPALARRAPRLQI